jgi:hypothetical protein
LQALQLYPAPDVLVLGDKFDPYTLDYEGCTAFNPGSFVSTNFQFMVYTPAKASAVDFRMQPFLKPTEFKRAVELSLFSAPPFLVVVLLGSVQEPLSLTSWVALWQPYLRVRFQARINPDESAEHKASYKSRVEFSDLA